MINCFFCYLNMDRPAPTWSVSLWQRKKIVINLICSALNVFLRGCPSCTPSGSGPSIFFLCAPGPSWQCEAVLKIRGNFVQTGVSRRRRKKGKASKSRTSFRKRPTAPAKKKIVEKQSAGPAIKWRRRAQKNDEMGLLHRLAPVQLTFEERSN